jgi:hypothetical protein
VDDINENADITPAVNTNAMTRSTGGSQMQRRDFGGTSMSTSSANTDALVAKERASTEARWIMAMRQPRNLDDVRQEIVAECKVPEFAKAAVYAKPVGGGNVVEGLSIRFAETAARLMGNISIETQTLYDDDSARMVRVSVTDFERNATWSKDLTIKKTIERKQLKRNQRCHAQRTNSYGENVYIVDATDDDVAIKEAALVSKAARTGVLRLVPGHIQREALELCKQVQRDKAAKDPDGERKQILDAFALLRVMPSDLEEYLGHPTTQIIPVEIERLRSIFTSIREGETSWREVLDAVREARAEAKPAAAATPSTSAPVTATETPAAKQKRGGAAALKADLKQEAAVPATAPTSFDKAAADARAKDAARAAAPEQATLPMEHKCTDCQVPLDAPGKCEACRNS